MEIILKKKSKKTKCEIFHSKYKVYSRSGLNFAERKIIESFSTIKNPKNILILENRTGVCNIIAKDMFPQAKIISSVIDIFYKNKIDKTFKENNIKDECLCQPYILERDFFDVVYIQVAKNAVSKELIADLIQNSYLCLKKGGKIFVSADGKQIWIKSLVEKKFYACTEVKDKVTSVYIAKKHKELKKIKSFKTEFSMTIKDKNPIRLYSIPGVFAHRRVDEGALALSEVCSLQEGSSLLDIGCGCGAIGIFLSVNFHLNEVSFLDSNARAIYITKENCLLNNVTKANFFLSDSGEDSLHNIDYAVANPPYFADYSISKLFIDIAYSALKKNGEMYLVTKSYDWHKEYIELKFNEFRVIKRRNYIIFIATK